eukprot:364743-Chlamydomonas_euryale.AAC.15
MSEQEAGSIAPSEQGADPQLEFLQQLVRALYTGVIMPNSISSNDSTCQAAFRSSLACPPCVRRSKRMSSSSERICCWKRTLPKLTLTRPESTSKKNWGSAMSPWPWDENLHGTRLWSCTRCPNILVLSKAIFFMHVHAHVHVALSVRPKHDGHEGLEVLIGGLNS